MDWAEKLKVALFLALIGYFILGFSLFVLSTPLGGQRGCSIFSTRHPLPFISPSPNRCLDQKKDPILHPLEEQPAFQVFVGGGLAAGVLAFYLDWLVNLFDGWRKKRAPTRKPARKPYRYQCRGCGAEWN